MDRIIFDCVAAKSTVSGLYQVCLNLGNALLQHIDASREQLTFYVHESQPALFGKDQRYLIHKETYRLFQRQLQACDVWHSTIQDARVKPRNRRIKVVLTIHDLNFLIQRKGEPSKIKKYLGRVQASINRADHIVCISEFTRQTVLQNLETYGKPVDLIYNGCTINEFPGYDTPVYRPARPFVFGLGALVPKKNFHVLPCLLQHNEYELIIAGTKHPEYVDQIMQQAAMYGVTDRVRLTGEITEQDKYWYLKNCTAFAFPSLAEGFGLPLIEAMYYGKPAFIAASTSLPEIGGDLAYSFDNFEPGYMQAVFANGMHHYETAKPMQAIHERALKYSWDQAAKEYLAIYRKLFDIQNQRP
jgi:glycosyltransferase involved in cell wall biosynthesis